MSNKLDVLIRDATLLLETQGVSSGVQVLLAGFRQGMRDVREDDANTADAAYLRGVKEGEAKATQSIADASNDAYKAGVQHGYEERNEELTHRKPRAPAEADGDTLKRMGANPVAWADEFCGRFVICAPPSLFGPMKEVPDAPGLMLGWFASAIRAGDDQGRMRERMEWNGVGKLGAAPPVNGEPQAPEKPQRSPGPWDVALNPMEAAALRTELANARKEAEAYKRELKKATGEIASLRATIQTFRELANIVRNI